eukprot:TRINITY_DN88461_c0_g1_i1.p1 TRINITY_DN88461_c0_g1~~TRINITY_DN88461_c0_g1_i1.p1  ORF type:complete len:313 (+),score=-0.59 TRINITY_DN88461_c0_g1_i1:126-941(+)
MTGEFIYPTLNEAILNSIQHDTIVLSPGDYLPQCIVSGPSHLTLVSSAYYDKIDEDGMPIKPTIMHSVASHGKISKHQRHPVSLLVCNTDNITVQGFVFAGLKHRSFRNLLKCSAVECISSEVKLVDNRFEWGCQPVHKSVKVIALEKQKRQQRGWAQNCMSDEWIQRHNVISTWRQPAALVAAFVAPLLGHLIAVGVCSTVSWWLGHSTAENAFGARGIAEWQWILRIARIVLLWVVWDMLRSCVQQVVHYGYHTTLAARRQRRCKKAEC